MAPSVASSQPLIPLHAPSFAPLPSQSSDRSRSSNSPNRASSSNSRIKTLADEIASTQGVTGTRKRKRVHYSCAECHRRKAKCDRETPCKPCVDRGLGDSCRPFSEGDEFGDERDRIKRLEDVVEGLARAHAKLQDELKGIKESRADPISLSRGDTTPADSIDVPVRSGMHNSKLKRSLQSTMPMIEREELRSSFPDDMTQHDVYGAREEMSVVHNTLEGGLTREGDSFYGALALPSVSRGTIETQVSPSLRIYSAVCFRTY